MLSRACCIQLLQVGLHEQYGGVKPDVARDAQTLHLRRPFDVCPVLYVLQVGLHEQYGGVKPDVARDAYHALTPLVHSAMWPDVNCSLKTDLQVGLHEQYGGVKPDVARDAHAAAIHSTVDEAALPC
jgi:tRNA A37 threonylcarbamoyltransferase TsaD